MKIITHLWVGRMIFVVRERVLHGHNGRKMGELEVWADDSDRLVIRKDLVRGRCRDRRVKVLDMWVIVSGGKPKNERVPELEQRIRCLMSLKSSRRRPVE